MITAISHFLRLARAGFVFAREGVLSQVDPTLVPVPARTALRLARLLERRGVAGKAQRLPAALT